MHLVTFLIESIDKIVRETINIDSSGNSINIY